MVLCAPSLHYPKCKGPPKEQNLRRSDLPLAWVTFFPMKKFFAAENWLNWLLIFLPVAVFLEFTHAAPVAIFASSCLAIIPLAGLMGKATEHLAEKMGAGIGGLLNVTFGNAAELIIAALA